MGTSDPRETKTRYRAVMLAMRLHQLADKLEKVCASLDEHIHGAPSPSGVTRVRADLIRQLLCPERFSPPTAPVTIRIDSALERLYPAGVDEYPSEPPTREDFDAAVNSLLRFGLAAVANGSLVLGPEAESARDGLKAAVA